MYVRTQDREEITFSRFFNQNSKKELNFEIFWKTTRMFRYIPKNSNYNLQHNMAVFNIMVLRLVNIPMNRIDFDKVLGL